jgi:hypothetical protein
LMTTAMTATKLIRVVTMSVKILTTGIMTMMQIMKIITMHWACLLRVEDLRVLRVLRVYGLMLMRITTTGSVV